MVSAIVEIQTLTGFSTLQLNFGIDELSLESFNERLYSSAKLENLMHISSTNPDIFVLSAALSL